MATTGDILAPKLLADGTFEEVTLTPAAIGAASLADGLVPASQLPPISYQSITHIGDGLTSAYLPPGTLTASDSPSAISVTINGVTQEPNADYTLDVAANRIVLSFLLPHLDKLVITRPILLPSNSTLTAEQLGAASTQALEAETLARTQADAALQSALDSKAPLLWDTSSYIYQTSSPDDIPITARRRQRLQIASYTPKANGATLTLPRRGIDGALDGDELEIVLQPFGTGVTATIHIRQFTFTGSSYLSSTSLFETLVRTNPSPVAAYLYRLVGGVWERVPLLAQAALDSKASTSALAALEARVAALEAASQP